MKLVRLRPNYLHLRGYRLPTEAEMEYAIRAGAATPRFFGATEDLLPKYAWYYNNSQTYLCPAGTLKPNDFGIFDAHGNVLTWCQERYKPGPQEGGTMDLPDDDKEDSLEIDTTIERPVRGGSFNAPPRHIHCSFRTRVLPDQPQRQHRLSRGENFDRGRRPCAGVHSAGRDARGKAVARNPWRCARRIRAGSKDAEIGACVSLPTTGIKTRCAWLRTAIV